MENNVQQEKSRKIDKLLEQGKAKGVLTYKEVMDTLDELELNTEQVESIYNHHQRYTWVNA